MYNRCLHTKPDFEDSYQLVQDYFPTHVVDPQAPPNDDELYNPAQHSKPDSSAGMDRIKLIVLKMLPTIAWTPRSRILAFAREFRIHHDAYHNLASPAIPKGDKLADNTKPKYRTLEEHRLIDVFSALYRVESGATFRQHLPRLKKWIHPDLHGCFPGREMSDVSWDAQAEVVHAMPTNPNLVARFLDYIKFFDAF